MKNLIYDNYYVIIMGKTDLELEKEADALLKQGSEHITEGNNDLAIPLLYKSKYLNLLLGYKAQAEKAEVKLQTAKKRVDRYDKSKRFSLSQDEKDKLADEGRDLFNYSKSLQDRNRIDDALMLYKEAYAIFDVLNLDYESKQAYWLIRRIEEEKKISAGLEKDKDVWKNFAEKAVDLGKLAVKRNEYNVAKQWYKDSIDIFKDLGYFDVVGGLYKERENIENLNVEYLKSVRQKAQERELREKKFQQRVDDVLTEKEKARQIELSKMAELPLEIKETLDKAQLLTDKAEKELQMNKFQRAIGRYQIIIDLYRSVPKDKIDLSEKVSEIEQKISELKSKFF